MSTISYDSFNTPNPLESAYAEMEDLVDHSCPNPSERMVSKYALQGNSEAVLELIYLEFVMLRERGGQPTAAQFQSRFPELSQQILALLEVDSVIGIEHKAEPHNSSQHSLDKNGLVQFERGLPRQLGQYLLTEVIGRGGMGVVYRANQMQLDRVVALKTLNILASLDQSARSRFQSEARLAAQLHHPNIVQIHEIGNDGGVPFFSMELIAGGTLSRVLKEGPLPPNTAAQLLLSMARAVEYAHSHGVIHRDLKPGNVLLSNSTRPDAPKVRLEAQDGPSSNSTSLQPVEPKIADFGLAKELEGSREITGSGAVLGTPSFMAPEQVVGATRIDGSCDVYALGAILYNMLSGQPPFLSANVIETIRLVQEMDPVPLRHLQPNTPRDLETICDKCMRKTPSARYSSAAELTRDVERFLAGLPIAARPAGPVERLAKWTRRHPSLTALFLLTLMALGTITWLWRSAELSRLAEQTARQRTEQSLYAHRFTMLYSQYRLNQINETGVRKRLDESPPYQRGWEWHYLRGICDQADWESTVNDLPIASAALSPDGRYAALGFGKWGYDHEQVVEVWDTWEGNLKWRLKGHPKSQVCSVQFSPDGNFLASSCIVWTQPKVQGDVRLWSMKDGSLQRIVSESSAKVIQYSTDGGSLFVGGMDGVIRQFSLQSFEVVREFKGLAGMVLRLCFSPNSQKMLVSARSDNWGVFDLQSGKPDWIMRNEGDIRQLCWSSDGKQLSIGGYDGRVRTFQYEKSGPILLNSEHFPAQLYQVASPDGMWRATTYFGHDIEVREERSGRLLAYFSGHGGDVRAIGFDSSCRRMISGGTDGVARVWSLDNPQPAIQSAYLPSGSSASCVSYHPKESMVAIAVKKNLSRAGRFQPTIELYESDSLRPIRSLKGHTDELTSVAYRDDGEQLVSAARDKTIRLWEPSTGKVQATLSGHQCAVILADYCHQNTRLISVDESGLIIQWDIHSGKPISQWQTNQTIALAASHPSRSLLVTVSKTGKLTIWDYSGQQPRVESFDFVDVNCVAFSRDGSYLAVASETQSIDLWETEKLLSGERAQGPAKRLEGGARASTYLCFSPDGTRLCAVGRDEMVRIYDTELGNELLSLTSQAGNEHLVSFSSNGRQVMRAAGTTILTWNILDRNSKLNSASNSDSDRMLQWHRQRITSAASSGHYQAAIYHAEALAKLEPGNRENECSLAVLKMKLGDWQGAEKNFRKGIELSSSIFNRSRFAITLLKLNNLEEFNRQCQLLAISAHLSNAYGIQMVARTIALAMEADIDYPLMISLLQKAQAKNPKVHLANTLALLQYRYGDFAGAIESARESMKASRTAGVPMDWMIIALAKAKSLDADGGNSGLNGRAIHPTVKQYAGLVIEWCGRQKSLIEAGKKPSANYVTACEELPFLYTELQKIAGMDNLPELVLCGDKEQMPFSSQQ